MKTPRQMLADYLQTVLDPRRTLLLAAPDSITQLEPGRHGIVLTTAGWSPSPARTGIRSYELDLWVVSPHADILRALDGLEPQTEAILQLLDKAPFEAVWMAVAYDQFAEAAFHAYRITMTIHLEVTYPE